MRIIITETQYEYIQENEQMDRILDKISKHGINSLNRIEKEYMDSHSQPTINKDVEDKLKKRINKKNDFMNYDPREDMGFYNDLGMDFSKYGDDQIDDDRYNILWDETDEEDIDEFILKLNIPKNTILTHDGFYKPYHELTSEQKVKWKKYIDTIY